MGDKLTLRLEAKVIAKAKRYGHAHGKSVSRLVADYLSLLERIEEGAGPDMAPLTASLHGAVQGEGVTE